MFGDYFKKKKILLVGGTGTLGSNIVKNNKFFNLDCPSSKDLNLKNFKSIKRFINNDYDIIIHCAGISRVKDCEENSKEAIEVNVVGTFNLVQAIKQFEKKNKKKIKLIYISSDAVYPSLIGNYKERSKILPYNVYGWTKYLSELIIKSLEQYVIIRTRFYTKNKFKYKDAATDIFSSMIDVNLLTNSIFLIIKKNFFGIINIGSKKKSDYKVYKIFNKNLIKCKSSDIIKKLNYKIGIDSSMDLTKYKKLKNEKN